MVMVMDLPFDSSRLDGPFPRMSFDDFLAMVDSRRANEGVHEPA